MSGRFVVTGSGRCGTHWMSLALTAAGIPCGHEIAHDYQVRGQWPDGARADSSWMAATMLEVVTDPVVLLVRHPLPVVASWVEIGFFGRDSDNPTHAPLRSFAPKVYRYEAEHDRALAMWLALNTAALRRAEMIIRLESIASTFPRLVAWAGGDVDAARDVARGEPSNHKPDCRALTGVAHEMSWDRHMPRLVVRARRLARLLGYVA
jgi:hypothetical protein